MIESGVCHACMSVLTRHQFLLEDFAIHYYISLETEVFHQFKRGKANRDFTSFKLSTCTSKYPEQLIPLQSPVHDSSCGATHEVPMLEAIASRASCCVIPRQ